MQEDLCGKVFLVTGASTGIGRVTAEELARRGGHVVLAGRSEARTAPVVEAIRRSTGNAQVDFLPVDLSDLGSVRSAAAAFLSRGLPLHVLVNNAGLAGVRGLTPDGIRGHLRDQPPRALPPHPAPARPAAGIAPRHAS